jgi:rubrerythrin
MAIAFEQRAAAYYAERMGATPAGSAEGRLYQELAAEEQEHVALLTTELERWRQGRRGIL